MKTWPLLSCLLLSGCAASFGDFYSSRVPSRPVASYSGKTEIYRTYDVAADAQTLRLRGYELIGESEFQSEKVLRAILEAQLKSHAKKVGADIVLWRQRAGDTVYSKVPVLITEPGESHLITTSSSVNASLQSGGVSAYGSASGLSTTLVQSSATSRMELVETARQRLEQRALFFRKVR